MKIISFHGYGSHPSHDFQRWVKKTIEETIENCEIIEPLIFQPKEIQEAYTSRDFSSQFSSLNNVLDTYLSKEKVIICASSNAVFGVLLYFKDNLSLLERVERFIFLRPISNIHHGYNVSDLGKRLYDKYTKECLKELNVSDIDFSIFMNEVNEWSQNIQHQFDLRSSKVRVLVGDNDAIAGDEEFIRSNIKSSDLRIEIMENLEHFGTRGITYQILREKLQTLLIN